MKLPPFIFPKKEAATTSGKTRNIIIIKRRKAYTEKTARGKKIKYFISISEYTALAFLA
jgi:hypothetical protein